MTTRIRRYTHHAVVVTLLVALGVGGLAVALARPGPHASGQPGSAAAGSRNNSAHGANASPRCSGPTGAAYLAEAGYQAFAAVETANCDLVQTYNVDDPQVPGDAGDYDYSGTDEGLALSDGTLWFAVTGSNNVAAIETSQLNPKNYSPAEKLIAVGWNPEALAVTPNGKQVWVADTGPQTTTSPVSGLTVIDAATYKVIASLPLAGNPTDVAFTPTGTHAYVTTSQGLYAYDTASRKMVWHTSGLGDPESVVSSPNGHVLYVTLTSENELATINPSNGHVMHTTWIGHLPWQCAVSPNGSTVYVAAPDSDAVIVVDAATGKV
ncbi:MAG TPA: YncE family protein, partial [Acidimicrobiales bacterium]|nr:YncE family protein [Acidimicrobiales bacterium]